VINLQRLPIAQLKPAPYNPRIDLKPGTPEYQRLERSLIEFDLVEPIVWNELTGHVVSGHPGCYCCGWREELFFFIWGVYRYALATRKQNRLSTSSGQRLSHGFRVHAPLLNGTLWLDVGVVNLVGRTIYCESRHYGSRPIAVYVRRSRTFARDVDLRRQWTIYLLLLVGR